MPKPGTRRVTAAFTVESHNPARLMLTPEQILDGESPYGASLSEVDERVVESSRVRVCRPHRANALTKPYTRSAALSRTAPPSELACSWLNVATRGLSNRSGNRTLCGIVSGVTQGPPSWLNVYTHYVCTTRRPLCLSQNQTPSRIIRAKPGTRRVTAAFTVESHNPARLMLTPEQILDGESPYGASLSEVDERVVEHTARTMEVTGLTALDGTGIDVSDVTPTERSANRMITHRGRVQGRPAAIAVKEPGIRIEREHVTRAVMEARQAVERPETVVIAAFSFAPNILETEQVSGLTVLIVRTNQELQIPTVELREKAFILVGEPVINIHPNPDGDGTVAVDVVGCECYDPHTGSTDEYRTDSSDIDCVMIDTNHDGYTFRADLVQFPNTDMAALTRLQKSLEGAIDNNGAKNVRCRTSIPFKPGPHATIAVRVITKYGDEMTKTLAVNNTADRS